MQLGNSMLAPIEQMQNGIVDAFWHASTFFILCNWRHIWHLAVSKSCFSFLRHDKMEEGGGRFFFSTAELQNLFELPLQTWNPRCWPGIPHFGVRLLRTLPSCNATDDKVGSLVVPKQYNSDFFQVECLVLHTFGLPTCMLDAGFQSVRMTVLMQQSFEGLNLDRN